MSKNLDSPLSLYSIPAALATVFYPHFKMVITYMTVKRWSNVAPRDNLGVLKESKKVTPDFTARVERMRAAHINGLEIFPLWIAGILAGNFAKLDNRTLNTHALAFLTLRSLYNYVYVKQTSAVMSAFRTIIWLGSAVVPLSLIFKAAKAVGDS